MPTQKPPAVVLDDILLGLSVVGQETISKTLKKATYHTRLSLFGYYWAVVQQTVLRLGTTRKDIAAANKVHSDTVTIAMAQLIEIGLIDRERRADGRGSHEVVYQISEKTVAAARRIKVPK